MTMFKIDLISYERRSTRFSTTSLFFRIIPYEVFGKSETGPGVLHAPGFSPGRGIVPGSGKRYLLLTVV